MTKTSAKDFYHLFSQETKDRKVSPLKTFIKYFGDPNMVFLGGGLPLSDYFPWDNIKVDIPVPPFTKGIGQPINKNATEITTLDLYKEKKVADGDIPLARSLQYGHSQGQPELLKFIREHTEIIHTMQYDDWELLVTAGNTSAWESTLRIFCNRGDTILAEAHSFSSSLSAAQAQGIITFPVPIDDKGIIPEKLAAIMDNWNPETPKPKLLYTIPTGQNPTGSSLDAERKSQVYKIAQKHDFLIVEDEPYYFLQMEDYVKDPSLRKEVKLSHDEFLASLDQTFLSIDTDGRVIRMDSFSKVLAPGSRLGWITCSNQIMKAYLALYEMSMQAAAGFTQSIVSATLSKWGQHGYLDWLLGLRHEYTLKRDNAIDACYKYIPQTDAFHINPPVAGMFFTITFDGAKHPEFTTKFKSDPLLLESYLYEKAVESGVIIAPGSWFITDGETIPPQPKESKESNNPNSVFFRGTFAAVAADKLNESLKRFGQVLHDEFKV
ncbi:hypothetical protein KAFR_0D01420 [Kazachstania africana CBS 2517]|uniref:aromatic-amino-acid transaminase n=1 Tax=Kazachstania africana (strain ATCC 22294 / BCRC 22015 / CBS 2517 / CECT 1963 / NBRC 1671 / NRRL Y-8276) TaxID=1071382 RepID=H2ATT8_KAZAF|nr:hypothetical protein KAFR_0D01420 [Kazachstania africana CBS 2517]CCF57788.1 hypothetical protein KAFR_0D01420 [Kazachstania africana CBS 2517]